MVEFDAFFLLLQPDDKRYKYIMLNTLWLTRTIVNFIGKTVKTPFQHHRYIFR